MSNHERDCCPLLLGEREELCPKIADHVAIERSATRDPNAIKDPEQEQWILWRLAKGFSLFD
jgi:hypothetical protein